MEVEEAPLVHLVEQRLHAFVECRILVSPGTFRGVACFDR
jgi:hypothetical protein